MNYAKSIITLLACCCIVLTIAPSTSADFVGVTTVYPDDPDTEFLCTQGNGEWVPGPLTVCKVFAVFDDPTDCLLSVGNADLQVYNGQSSDLFFRHPLHYPSHPFTCGEVSVFPDMICSTSNFLGFPCSPSPPEYDGTTFDDDFDAREYNYNGHIVGGWFDEDPSNGQGVAGNYSDLQLLFLQSSVARGLSMSGDIDIFWTESWPGGDTVWEADVPIECAATCGSCPTDSDGDGDTDAMDLAVLLGNWGPDNAGHCLDTDENGLIGPFDLAVLLGAWGPCP